MSARHILLLAGAALLLAITPAAVQAQDDDDDGHIYTVSTNQWPFNNLEEIFELLEEDQGLLEQNEFIVSQKTLVHRWGGAISVMTISEYASWDDIIKSQERADELFEAKYPKEKDREARNEEFSALTGDGMHQDNIMQEQAGLTK